MCCILLLVVLSPNPTNSQSLNLPKRSTHDTGPVHSGGSAGGGAGPGKNHDIPIVPID